MMMEQAKKITVAIKYAEIDDLPFNKEQEGWVSCLANRLQETLAFYFRRPVELLYVRETETITDAEFRDFDAMILVLSPAFLLSSNLPSEISMIEKAFTFNINYINAKIHKVLKGPVEANLLPTSISMGAFHRFYQLNKNGDSGYETLFDWDKTAKVRTRYWDSFTNLIFDLLRNIQHEKQERFMPQSEQTIFLGSGDLSQLWNRTNLYGELHARGIKVLPDHDHSIEVKYLNNPLKFYLEKSSLAIHFPEEFLPLNDKKLNDLAEVSSLKRYIWFNPEVAKNSEKQKQYDELKQKLKNLDHVEAVSSGIEELKEIIFSRSAATGTAGEAVQHTEAKSIYLLFSEKFEEALGSRLRNMLGEQGIELLLLEGTNTSQKRQLHYRHLKQADYCLICYDGSNADWVRANINEVKKAAGLNPDKPKHIKLGVLCLQHPQHELSAQDQAYTLLMAAPEQLEETINRFLYEN